MKSFLIIFLAIIMSACSIEENNRKKFAERAADISNLHNRLNASEGIVRNESIDTITYLEISDTEKKTYHFTKPDHPAHPSVVTQLFERKTFKIWWDWNSAATKPQINEYFYKVLSETDELAPLNCSLPRVSPCAEISQYPDSVGGMYSDELMQAYYEAYSDCGCQVKVRESKLRI